MGGEREAPMFTLTPALSRQGRGENKVIPLFVRDVTTTRNSLAQNEAGEHFSIQVTEKHHGRRLDQFLSGTHLNLSRSRAKNLVEKHLILLNQRPTKPSAHVKTGDMVSGFLPEAKPLSLQPEPLPLTILYEDPSIIVIDKPSGMVVHPAYGNPSGTLVNALLYHCEDLEGINGVLRPGSVHRLDKDTSGVMVVAKEDQAFHHLTKQFKNRIVEKVYWAIVYGKLGPSEGLIDSAIGRHPSERKRMSTRTKRGRAAVTRWKKVEEFDGCTLLEISPQTGRTHQIRVHLSSIGHPVLGDPLYGRKGRPGAIRDPVLKECVKRINRQALHAQRLKFTHPRTEERVQFVAPTPEDMKEALEWLRLQSKHE
jgi:23S rRNA pseudouridine1911/1915/1917 synthase